MPLNTPNHNNDSDTTFARALGVVCDYNQADKTVFTLTVEQRHLNRGGVMHGGMTCTLLDSTCGTACLFGQRAGATISLTTNYTAPAKLGDKLTCTAVVSKRTKTLAFVDATVVNQNNQIIATATGVFRIIALTTKP